MTDYYVASVKLKEAPKPSPYYLRFGIKSTEDQPYERWGQIDIEDKRQIETVAATLRAREDATGYVELHRNKNMRYVESKGPWIGGWHYQTEFVRVIPPAGSRELNWIERLFRRNP